MNQPQLPVFVHYISALAPPIIAVFVAYIAYMQWRTAHQRVVLELFDRRLQAYTSISNAIGFIARHGKVSASDPSGEAVDGFIQFLRSTELVPFLFGRDVEDYLNRVKNEIISMQLAESMMIEKDDQYSRWVTKKHNSFRNIMNFYEEFPKLCEPYLRLDEKRVRWPWSWVREFVLRRKRKFPNLDDPRNKDGG